MSIVAVQEARGTAPRPVEGRTTPTLTIVPPAFDPTAAIADPAGQARRLQAAIDHHRAVLAALLDQRCQHAAVLYAAGWRYAAIGRLYRLTRERVRHLVAAVRASTDDGAEGGA